MAHCAEVDNSGIVKRVIAVMEEYPDKNGGTLSCEQWCEKTYGGTWKKTSYNTELGVHKKGGTPLRKNFAGIGFIYDNSLDAFISPKPSENWNLDKEKGIWIKPNG